MDVSSRLLDRNGQAKRFGEPAGGGWLCLDFANMARWHREETEGPLGAYAVLLSWAEYLGVLSRAAAAHLLAEADHRHREVEAVVARAADLREALFRIFTAVGAAGSPRAADLETLNAALVIALPHLRVALIGDDYDWIWAEGEQALDFMLWPVARSAAELLTSDRVDRIGVCANTGCGWLFYDSSRNRSRRWCDMASCGNQAKARRHYRRHKEAS